MGLVQLDCVGNVAPPVAMRRIFVVAGNSTRATHASKTLPAPQRKNPFGRGGPNDRRSPPDSPGILEVASAACAPVLHSAAHLADKVFRNINREPASVVPPYRTWARMLLAVQTRRAVRVSHHWQRQKFGLDRPTSSQQHYGGAQPTAAIRCRMPHPARSAQFGFRLKGSTALDACFSTGHEQL